MSLLHLLMFFMPAFSDLPRCFEGVFINFVVVENVLVSFEDSNCYHREEQDSAGSEGGCDEYGVGKKEEEYL